MNVTLPDWRSKVAKLRGLLSGEKAEMVLEALTGDCEEMEGHVGDLLLASSLPTGPRSKGGSAFPKRRCKPYRDWIKDQPCAVAEHGMVGRGPCGPQPGRYKIECCHLIPKARGSDDRGNCFPACPVHHDEQEGRTAEFERKYGLNLTELVATYDAAFARENGL